MWVFEKSKVRRKFLSRSNFKKICSKLLVAIIIFTNLPICVFGAPTANPREPSNIDDLRVSAEERYNYFVRKSSNTLKGETGLLYNIQNIFGASIWFDFIQNPNNGLGFQKPVVDNYKDSLMKYIENFNKDFIKEGEDYAGCTLNTADNNDAKKFNINAIIKDVTSYLEVVLEKVTSEYDNLTDEEKIEYINTNRVKLRTLFSIVNTPINECTNIDNATPWKLSYDSTGNAHVTQPWTYKANFESIVSLITKDKYAEILQKAKAISEEEAMESNDADVDNKQNLLKRFFKDGNTSTGVLNNAFYTLFSASAVYIPFTSHAGDTNFGRAIKKVAKDEQTAEGLLKFYAEAKNYKKPLYFREKTVAGKNYGDARRITLGEFIDLLENDKAGALVLQKGKLVKGKDTNAWEYYNDQRFEEKEVVDGEPLGVEDEVEDKDSDTDVKEEKEKETSLNPIRQVISNLIFPSVYAVEENNKEDKDGEEDKEDNKEKVSKKDKSESDENNEKQSAVSDFIVDNDIITDETKMTDPVFKFGRLADFTNRTDMGLELGTVVMKNIICDLKDNKVYRDSDNMFLFLNAFGDIVTQDDIVILPGSSNPYMFGDSAPYYPYTVAFMKYYPSLIGNVSSFTTSNGRDKGKYVLEGSFKGDNVKNDVMDGKYLTFDNKENIYARKISGKKSVELVRRNSLTKNLQTKNSLGDKGSFVFFKKLEFKGFIKDILTSGEYFMIKDRYTSAEETACFSLYEYDKENVSDVVLGSITQDMKWALYADKDGNSSQPNGRINEEFFAKQIIPEALNGSSNAMSYVKDILQSYDRYVGNSYERFKVFIAELITPSVDAMSKYTGVLGIKNGFSSGLFGSVVRVLDTVLFFVAMVIIVLILSRFVRKFYSFTYTVIVIALLAGFCYIYINIIPVYVPTVFNAVNNNLSRNIAYKSLMTGIEKYDKVYGSEDNIDKDGRLLDTTSSINLYKFSMNELAEFCRRNNLSKKEVLTGGEAYMLDIQSGLFVEGNIVKVNLGKLFRNLPITGQYINHGDKMVYQITCDKMSSNNIDYYTPYSLFLDSFINKLNTFGSIYDLDRATLNYGNFEKDSFLPWSYFHSSLFMTPGDYSYDEKILDPDVLDVLRESFGNNKDYLGMVDILEDLPDNANQSLWVETMARGKYFEDEDKIRDLVEYVNLNTKKFILDNELNFKGMSDENIIKTVCLVETMLFSQRAGGWDDTLYPMFLNYEEINLRDLMLSIFTDDTEMFSILDMDIGKYFLDNYGVIHLYLIYACMGLIAVISQSITILLPILYLMFGAVIFGTFVVGKSLKPVCLGFAKCVFITFAGFTAMCFSFKIIDMGSPGKGDIWGLLLSLWLIAIVLTSMIVSLVVSPFDMGNHKMESILNNILDRIHLTTFFTGAKLRRDYDKDLEEQDYNDYNDYGTLNSFKYDASVHDMMNNNMNDIDSGLDYRPNLDIPNDEYYGEEDYDKELRDKYGHL